MRNRRGVRKRGRPDSHRHADPPPEAVEKTVPSPAERLDYIAQLVAELRAMAADANELALAVLLELAYQEAVRKRLSR
jgi:hypothetical protein